MATPTTSPKLVSSSFFSSYNCHAFSCKTYSKRNTNYKRICMGATAKGVHQSRKTLSSDWDLPHSDTWCSSISSFELLDSNEKLLAQRIVFLGSQLDETVDLVVSQLLTLDACDPTKDIKLFINSPGGMTTNGMAIYDAMKLCKADISTVCFGLAANVAAFLLASGTKGKRLCMPNARVMIQKPEMTDPEELVRDELITESMYQTTKMLKIYSKITGKSYDQIFVDTSYENFMDPWQAKEYGLVDAVVNDGKPGLIAPVPNTAPPPDMEAFELRELYDLKVGN